MKTKTSTSTVRYFSAYPASDVEHAEFQIRNGSFIRFGNRKDGGGAWYANGDFMDVRMTNPEALLAAGHIEVPVEKARRLIPRGI